MFGRRRPTNGDLQATLNRIARDIAWEREKADRLVRRSRKLRIRWRATLRRAVWSKGIR